MKDKFWEFEDEKRDLETRGEILKEIQRREKLRKYEEGKITHSNLTN